MTFPLYLLYWALYVLTVLIAIPGGAMLVQRWQRYLAKRSAERDPSQHDYPGPR